MEFFRKWFGAASSSEAVQDPEEPVRYSARVEARRATDAAREYQDDASFAWSADEPLSSRLFDQPARGIALVEDAQEDEDNGYDPYDTGRFGGSTT
jgi:hypothetical protein